MKDFYDTPRKDASTLKLSKNVQKELVKSERKLNNLEGQAKKLFKEQRRLFELARKEISEMTEEQMPRKGAVETIKVTLNVPDGKLPGKDFLMFKYVFCTGNSFLLCPYLTRKCRLCIFRS